MPYQSNLPQISAQHRRATAGGLLAAVQVPMNRVKNRLRGGFKTGNFVTGHSVAGVNHSEPEMGPNGMFILFGTDLAYNAHWELGHFNLFTQQFERVEIWVPEFLNSRTEQLAAFQRVYSRLMGGGAGGGTQRTALPRSPR